MLFLCTFVLLSLASSVFAFEMSLDIGTSAIPRVVPRAFQSACSPDSSPDLDQHDGQNPTAIDFVASALLGKNPLNWSFEPFCLRSNEAAATFCVYTNRGFSKGRGISFISQPQHARKATEIPRFQSPAYFEDSDDDPGAELTETKFERRTINDRGKGVIATGSLYPGDRIFSTSPILAVQDDIMQAMDNSSDLHFLLRVAINRLPTSTQKLFWGMHGHFGDDPYYDRLNTNAFIINIGKATGGFWAVLPESARLNHDCRPNTVYYLDPVTLTHNLHIVRPVSPGEELTNSYVSPYLTWFERQKRIYTQWGFLCSCSHCNQPSMQNDASDSRIRAIIDLELLLQDTSEYRTANLSTAELLVSLYEQERLDGAVGKAFSFAALEAVYAADKTAAAKWANLAWERMMMWEGPRHPITQKVEGMIDGAERMREWNWTAKMQDARRRD